MIVKITTLALLVCLTVAQNARAQSEKIFNASSFFVGQILNEKLEVLDEETYVKIRLTGFAYQPESNIIDKNGECVLSATWKILTTLSEEKWAKYKNLGWPTFVLKNIECFDRNKKSLFSVPVSGTVSGFNKELKLEGKSSIQNGRRILKLKDRDVLVSLFEAVSLTPSSITTTSLTSK